MAFIAAREKIHPSRVRLYISTSEDEEYEGIAPVNPEDKIRRGVRACGGSQKNPLLVSVEVRPGPGGQLDRTSAALPLGVWVEGGRAVGTGAAVVGGSFGKLAKKCWATVTQRRRDAPSANAQVQ